MSGNLSLSLIVKMVDGATAPLRRLNDQIAAMQAPARRFSAEMNRTMNLVGVNKMREGLRGIGHELTGLAFKMTALTGAMGYAFKTQFIDTAAEFEKYKTVLMTFYGTADKAQSAMDWVSDFAAKTPYELGEVTQGFIELKSFGLDPTKGALKATGDAAAGMGKPLEMAANTLASALRGQAEMLDNFGIFGRIEKDKMILEWVDNAGKKFKKAINKQNRDLIATTITAIWNQKYGGSMDRLSTTWIGVISNISDQWTRLTNKIMTSGGGFEKLKAILNSLLDRLNYLQTPEGMKQLEGYSEQLAQAIDAISASLNDAWSKLKAFSESVGGFGNLAKIVFGAIAAIMAGPLLLAVTQLVQGFALLAAAMLANPAVAVITALAVAIGLLIKNWDNLKASVGGYVDKFFQIMDGVPMFPALPATAPAAPIAAPLAPPMQTISGEKSVAKIDTGGELKITVDDQRTRISGVKTNDPRQKINIDHGPIMNGHL